MHPGRRAQSEQHTHQDLLDGQPRLSPVEQSGRSGKQPLDLAIASQQWDAVQVLVGAGAAGPGCRNPPSPLAAARRTITETLLPQGDPAVSPGGPLRTSSLGQGLTSALVGILSLALQPSDGLAYPSDLMRYIMLPRWSS